MSVVTKRRECAGQYRVLQDGYPVAHIVKDRGVEQRTEFGSSFVVEAEGWHIMNDHEYEIWSSGTVLPLGFKTLKEAFNECKEIYS